jgi:hypothetical protein
MNEPMASHATRGLSIFIDVDRLKAGLGPREAALGGRWMLS